MPFITVPAHEIKCGDSITLNGTYLGKVQSVRRMAMKVARLDKYAHLTPVGDKDAHREYLPHAVKVRKATSEEGNAYATVPGSIVLGFGAGINRTIDGSAMIEVWRAKAAA